MTTVAPASARPARRARGARRLAARGLRLAALLSAAGCGEVTSWDVEGEWTGLAAVPGTETGVRTAPAGDIVRGASDDRIRLCALRDVLLSLNWVPVEVGRPAALEIRTADGLCEEGATPVVGGTVQVYQTVGGDPNTLRAEPAEGWTLEGEVVVTGHTEPGTPDLDAGESAIIERTSASFSVTATHSSGQVIRIEEATLELAVRARRFVRSPA